VILDRKILGRSVRDRMAQHSGPYVIKRGTPDGSMVYIAGAPGWNMFGVFFTAPEADCLIKHMTEAA
jgi:hypothetical protein